MVNSRTGTLKTSRKLILNGDIDAICTCCIDDQVPEKAIVYGVVGSRFSMGVEKEDSVGDVESRVSFISPFLTLFWVLTFVIPFTNIVYACV